MIYGINAEVQWANISANIGQAWYIVLIVFPSAEKY